MQSSESRTKTILAAGLRDGKVEEDDDEEKNGRCKVLHWLWRTGIAFLKNISIYVSLSLVPWRKAVAYADTVCFKQENYWKAKSAQNSIK
jgi:hypothetical protein